MKWLRAFARFWYDFIVGDDWRLAAGVVLVVTATAIMARRFDVWLLVPLGVAATQTLSLRRAARTARQEGKP